VHEPRRRALAWTWALLPILGLAVAVRVLFWPTPGLPGDLDQFVLWVHGIANGGLANAYDQNLSFPPVMAYIWGALATLEPALRTVTTSADPAIRAIMKAPASLADLALGAVVVWHLRATPRWALLGGAAILLHPAVIDVSAWWGQYESIYVLGGVVAYVLAVRGHSLWAAAALAVALMTKPQALPFLVPFGAWFLGRDGWRGAARAAPYLRVLVQKAVGDERDAISCRLHSRIGRTADGIAGACSRPGRRGTGRAGTCA